MKRGLCETQTGGQFVLTRDEEQYVAANLEVIARLGHGLTSREARNVIKHFLDSKGRATSFKDNRPSAAWLKHFLRRQPTPLSLRRPQNLQNRRAACTSPEILRSFFDEVWTPTVERCGLSDKPWLIYNVDETGFSTNLRGDRIIVKRGERQANRVICGSGRDMFTVVACGNAAGQHLPLTVLFGAQHLYLNWIEGASRSTHFLTTPTGWMTKDGFFSWFRDVFIPNVPAVDSRLGRHLILILDGHTSHFSIPLVELAKQHLIHIIRLPPHTSHLLQPLDVGVFAPMKSAWTEVLQEHTHHAVGRGNITKATFSSLLAKVEEKSLKPQHFVAGFESTGLFPVNPDRIAPAKLAPSASTTTPESSTPVTRNQESPRTYVTKQFLSLFKSQTTGGTSPSKRVKIDRDIGECITLPTARKRVSGDPLCEPSCSKSKKGKGKKTGSSFGFDTERTCAGCRKAFGEGDRSVG